MGVVSNRTAVVVVCGGLWIGEAAFAELLYVELLEA